MRKAVGYLGIGIFLAILIIGFLAYILSYYNPNTHITHDALGRPLEKSPWFVRLFFGAEYEWPGLEWFILDFFIFWSSVGIGVLLVKFGFGKSSKKDT